VAALRAAAEGFCSRRDGFFSEAEITYAPIEMLADEPYYLEIGSVPNKKQEVVCVHARVKRISFYYYYYMYIVGLSARTMCGRLPPFRGEILTAPVVVPD
jgi:hypothetical protein